MMKKTSILALLVTVMLTSGCTSKQKVADIADNQACTPAEALLQRLKKVADSGKTIFGHHDDTAYGTTWAYEEGRSDVKDIVGDYPGLMNWDLGLIERGTECQLDGVPFEFIRKEAIAQDARGGINSFSWHPRNPATGGDTWDTSVSPVSEMVTDGTAMNDSLRTWALAAADFMMSLTDTTGNRIPVLFRPWHEHTGSWFWWGKDSCTPDEYKALWRITREVFDQAGADNIVWVYSPDRLSGYDEYIERYPGDSLVDVLGNDAYHHNGADGYDEFMQRARTQLDAALKLSKENGKLITLSETGLESLPMADWWTKALLPLCKEYPIAFACVWRNARESDKPGHFFAPYPGQQSEASFKEFYNDSTILFARDIAEIQ